ncbi:MAG TPA: RDD family protein [Phycisphaerales bacterium]|nr:RDD family protein [Phycisphaerales bacterium]
MRVIRSARLLSSHSPLARSLLILLVSLFIAPFALAAGKDDDQFLLTACGADASSPTLAGASSASQSPSASSGKHLWIVRKSRTDEPGFEVLHCFLTADPPAWKRLWVLPTRPARIAAWENRIWFLFDDQPRSIQSLDALYNPAFGEYYASPGDRLRILSSLDSWGYIRYFSADPDGPVVLLSRDQPGPHRALSNTESAEPKYRLFQMVSDRWQEFPLPQRLVGQQVELLASGMSGSSVIQVLDADASDPNRFALYTLHSNDFAANATQPAASQPVVAQRSDETAISQRIQEAWIKGGREEFSIDLARIRRIVSVLGNPLIARANQDKSIELLYVRAGSAIHLAQLENPPKSWDLLSTGSNILYLTSSDANLLQLAAINPITGEVSLPQTIAEQTTSFRKIWKVALTFSAFILGLLAIFLLKPTPEAPIEKVKLLGFLPRCAAILIDLFPSSIVAILILKSAPTGLLEFPALSMDVVSSSSNLLAVCLTILHCTLSELLWGRSLGKTLIGARIITMSGARPNALDFLKRNAAKLLIMLMPPLAIIVVLNHNMQGLHDMFAKTLVVEDPDEDVPPDKSDDESADESGK